MFSEECGMLGQLSRNEAKQARSHAYLLSCKDGETIYCRMAMTTNDDEAKVSDVDIVWQAD